RPRIARSVRERLAAVLAERDAVVRGDEAAAVHRMRVATRRLRAVLEVGVPWLDKRAATAMIEPAREVGKSLGRLREEQVSRALFDRVAEAAFGPELVAADHVRMRLARRARRRAERVGDTLEGKALAKLGKLAGRATGAASQGTRAPAPAP